MRLANRWIFLVVQFPAQPSNARVKTWRRLQQLGAVAIKNAVYVLPNSAQAAEDFEWLRSEVETSGGDAAIFTGTSLVDGDDEAIVAAFRTARAADFKALATDAVRATRGRAGRDDRDDSRRAVRLLRERLDSVNAIDFFNAPGSEAAAAAVAAAERRVRPEPMSRTHKRDRVDREQYRSRTWVTRPRPGVDRFACAWLIRRFIDREAEFAFAATPDAVPDGVPFDMYTGGFRHEDGRCTFEVLSERFELDDPTLRRLGEIVHDVDLKDERFRSPQAPTIAAIVDGLRVAHADDGALLQHGIAVFEALYEGLKAATRTPSSSRKRLRK